MRVLFCVFFTAVFLLSGKTGFCQESDTVAIYTSYGVVTQVDSIGSVLVIDSGNEEMKFTVDPETKIQRGEDDIMLDDLESNDNVNVKYYRLEDGGLKAVLINDNNIAASF
ncbi:MAG: DUF5666 domain-containing protein [Candidatus Omnitrophica bacterium]|nr:DUF5666 domain-containing protein [Candidatus Omnitrophota bacterium]